MQNPLNNSASRSEPLATKPFILVCLATGLGYANQWVMIPLIPLYVHTLGGSTFLAGLAMLAFAVPSFTVRPFVGRVADQWSAAGVLGIGLVGLAAGTLILLVPGLGFVFIAMMARGLGWAGVNTGGYTTLAMVAPASRRGEAAGYFSSLLTGASVLFPALGLWLIEGPVGFQGAFLVATAFGLIGLPLALGLKKSHRQTNDAPPAAANAGGSSFIDRGVLLAAGLNLCTSLVSPALMAFMPLYASSLGIANIGWFYVLSGITSIVIRPLLGKQSDAVGRGPAIAIGLGAQLIGLILIIVAEGIGLILAGGFFVTLGAALIGATTTALAMDLADPSFRGRAMATFSMSFQMGAGAGALISGALADLTGLRGMYMGSVVITFAGLVLLAGAWKSLPRPSLGA